MSEVIIVGGGAAGLFAAVSALDAGHKVLVLEKMPYAGKKILITGKGRCNLTNTCNRDEFLKNIPRNSKFLQSSLSALSAQDLLDWFEAQKMPTKVERGQRAFPVSDKASDVRDTLVNYITAHGGQIKYNTSVKELCIQDNKLIGVKLYSGKIINADKVILACGGASYPTTGSDGRGYDLACAVGHTIVPIHPGLVPLECELNYQDLQGLSLKNVTAKLLVNEKVIALEFGEMLFAHFGLTGPIILSLSNLATEYLSDKNNVVEIVLDLKPALDEKTLDLRLQKELNENSKQQLNNVMRKLMPAALIATVLDMSFVEGTRQASQLSKQERHRIIKTLKGLTFEITATRPFNEAIITVGGINTKEVSPKTLQSKILPGLYFAGEMLDIHGFTGGFNLQIAFCTGYRAGLLLDK